MHGDSTFVDTNVILYSVDARDAGKQVLAQAWMHRLWETGSGRLSWQVLNEFYVNATRKAGLNREPAREIVRSLTQWMPCETTPGLLERAWHWSDRAQLSYWDSLILAAAERTGCRWLLSEDFQEGRTFEGVTVVHPFRRGPS